MKQELPTANRPPVQRVFLTRTETRAYYNKISKIYDLLALRSEARVRRAGLARLAARPGEKILEVGFGTGHCLVELAKAVGQAGRVYGIDLSDQMVRLAGELLAREGLSDRTQLDCGDAADLPYHRGTMDAVFMSFTLELFDTPDIPQVLQECRRVLKEQGRIVVVGLSKDGPGGVMVKIFEWVHQHFPKLVDCRPIYVRSALEQAGFKVTDSVQKYMWVPVEIVLASRS